MNKTQKVGTGVAIGGAILTSLGVGIAGFLSMRSMQVGASPSELVMQILQLLFGGGVPLTIGGILTAVISWFRNRNNPSLQESSVSLPQLGLNLQGVSSAELVELTSAFVAFLKDRNNVPNQKRLIVALTGIADIVPNLTAEISPETELVLRYKLTHFASLVSSKPTIAPHASMVEALHA